MSVFKDIDVIVNIRNCYLDAKREKTYKSIIKHLLCRLIDVYEEYPKDFPDYIDAEEWLRDFISDNGDYVFELYERGENYSLGVTNFNYDNPREEKYRIPSCILKDDWVTALNEDLKVKKILALEKEIESLKKIIKEGPSKLVALEKELEDLKGNNPEN